MAKPWYKSKAIMGAASTYLGTAAAIAIDCWQERRPPTPDEWAILLVSLETAGLAIWGRISAKTPIQGSAQEEAQKIEIPATPPSPDEVFQYPSVVNAIEIPATPPSPDEVFQYPSVVNAAAIEPNTDIDDQELDILLEELSGKYRIVVAREAGTFLKTKPIDSTKLPVNERKFLNHKEGFEVESWAIADSQHLKLGLGHREGYVFRPHVSLFNLKGEEVSLFKEKPAVQKTPIKLPGYTSTFYLEDPIYPGSHFTWREALRQGERMPYEKAQVDGIIAIARELDDIRAMFGHKPMMITSWLRPDRPVDINAAVGGARNSQHIQGHAVDFYIPGLNIWAVQQRMESEWRQGGSGWRNGGLGLGAKKGFQHIDLGPRRCWPY